MSHRPPEPPREPYGALATFLIVPLIAATVAFTAPHAESPPPRSYVGASLNGVAPAPVALPKVVVRRDSTTRTRGR